MYKLIKTNGKARRGEINTVHGTVQTPAFMNVATCGAIKGAVSALDLKELRCQVQLCNTYHLHLRPGDETVKKLGGVHRFTRWDGPILTDSGGFQVFSLAKLRNIKEEGVTFASHIDGHKIFMGPEESMTIQSNLGSTIAMAFDECIENPAEYHYTKRSCDRTFRWLCRCQQKMQELNAREDTINPHQLLFGINQGSTYDDIRADHMKRIAELELDGYAIGGLAVGEPVNILEAVKRGIDMFDCVMPTRNARHANVFTWSGRRNMMNEKYSLDTEPIDTQCDCPVCRNFTRAYIRHLFKSGEMLAMRLCVMHNVYFYNTLLMRIRQSIENDEFDIFYHQYKEILDKRI